MAKKKLTIEDVLVPKEEIPYEVPENWCWVNLKNVISTLETGKRPKGGVAGISEGVPSLGGEHLRYDGGFNIEKVKYVPNEFVEQMKKGIVEKNDILIVKDGATTGKTSFVDENFPFEKAVINEHVFKCRANEMILLPKYLYRFISSPIGQEFINNNLKGSAQGGINTKFIENYVIPLPPLVEQERIVNRIESLLEKVDRASELIEEARKGFEKRRAAILEKAFSGELTNSWRHENNIKNEWKTEKLSHYIKLISGQHIMSKDYNEESIGVPYLTGPSDFNEIYPVVSKWTESPKAMATTDDILITVKGSGVGKVNICNIDEVAISRQLMAIRCLKVNNIYLFWYLKYKFNSLQQLSTGTAIPGLSRGDILDLEINIPLEEEQQKVVDILQYMLSKESQIDNATEIFDNVEVIKKSILGKAFRGELGSNNLEEECSIKLLNKIIN